MVEQLPVKKKVPGSSPGGGAKIDCWLKEQSGQMVLSSHNVLNYPLTSISAVPSS